MEFFRNLGWYLLRNVRMLRQQAFRGASRVEPLEALERGNADERAHAARQLAPFAFTLSMEYLMTACLSAQDQKTVDDFSREILFRVGPLGENYATDRSSLESNEHIGEAVDTVALHSNNERLSARATAFAKRISLTMGSD